MNAVEIVLLIIGFISISVSFFVGNRKKDSVDQLAQEDGSSKNIWTEKEEEMVREQIHTLLEEEKENTIVETTDFLNRKSNEKIIEFDEFSSQILEKINQNHNEVVFMYSMLSDKESELKDEISEKSSKKVAVQENDKTVETVQKNDNTELQAVKTAKKTSAKVKENKKEAVAVVDSEAIPDKSEINNRIIELYKQGKSTLDISRELKVGQGEVKLMISLYGGRK